jgi:hypothetical protein
VAAHQPLQGIGQLLAQALALKELPVVELHAVGQAEPLQEIAPVQGHRFLQGVQVVRAGPQQAPKALHVQPQPGLGIQAHALPIHEQPFFAQGLAQRREVAAQAGAGAARLQLRPEQGDQRLPRVALTPGVHPAHGQVGEQGNVLVSVKVEGRAIALDARGAEERQLEFGHESTSLVWTYESDGCAR